MFQKGLHQKTKIKYRVQIIHNRTVLFIYLENKKYRDDTCCAKNMSATKRVCRDDTCPIRGKLCDLTWELAL